MKRLILFSFFLSAFVIGAMAQKGKKAKKEESAAVVKEAVSFPELQFDFGKIPQGKPATHVFYVENNGLDTLSIEHVQTSCGCTTPEYSHDPVLKGKKAEIKVGYNAATEGSFEKMITVTYNGGQTKQLIIKGIVWKTPDQSVPGNQALKVFQ